MNSIKENTRPYSIICHLSYLGRMIYDINEYYTPDSVVCHQKINAKSAFRDAFLSFRDSGIESHSSFDIILWRTTLLFWKCSDVEVSMRIAICDDDKSAIRVLRDFIEEYFGGVGSGTPEISEYTRGEDLLKDSEESDIIFLDIEMPGTSGIDVGRELKERFPDAIVIIVTAYNDYLDDAMSFRVFRYLSKPIDKDRLFRNLKDALRALNERDDMIVIETKDGIKTIHSSDFIFLELQTRNINIYTRNGVVHPIKPMKYWVETLRGAKYFQTHRSYIVNMEHVSEFTHSSINLCKGEYRAFLTKRKYTEFKEAYLLYLEGTR